MRKLIASVMAFFYRLGLELCQASYRLLPFRIKKVNAKVISVGNITWGGTGKTPLVIKLAKDLSRYGKKVAVLTRGYAGGDEAVELKKKLPNIPVIVDRDRVRGARTAVQQHGVDYLILDDGFQHIRLARQLDVVTLNATEPFGPGGLIPLGTLREPLSRLSRADVFVLTNSYLGSQNIPKLRQKLHHIQPKAHIYEAVHKPLRLVDYARGRTLSLHEMKHRKVATICAIGDPQSFEKTVEGLGAEIVFAARFDDHYRFTQADLEAFVAQAKELGAREVVTTEKDYSRIEPHLQALRPACPYSFLVLEIEFHITDDDQLFKKCVHA